MAGTKVSAIIFCAIIGIGGCNYDEEVYNAEQGRKMTLNPKQFELSVTLAETEGFEPSDPVKGLLDFESRPL